MNTLTKDCRVCNGPLEEVLDLGFIHPSDFLLPDQFSPKPSNPLVLARCEICHVVQLLYTTDQDTMYRNYWYRSGINPSMVNALQDVVDSVLKRYGRDHGTVIDIGCNDGTMLSMFPDNFYKIGYDPALNLRKEAEENCNLFINDYFGAMTMTKEADIVTAIAMFYDLDDPHAFLRDVVQVLDYKGIFVIQMMDLISMLEANAFDNICQEHLCYYSLLDIDRMLLDYDLEIFDVEYNKVNGGSIRIYISWKDTYCKTDEYYAAMDSELDYLALTKNPITAFANRVMGACLRTMKCMAMAKAKGLTIHGLCASTKGNTLLQYMGLKPPIIDKIYEVNEDKFGKETVSTRIPIVSEDEFVDPDILLVLAWHFEEFFVEKFMDYLECGGKLFFPLPSPHTVSMIDSEVKVRFMEKASTLPWA